MRKQSLVLTIVMSLCMPFAASADAPTIKSGTPVVYLAHNLDEKDNLGWCIDTVGRGFAEKLHAHSCKPKRQQALDTQFSYHKESLQIRSVPFADKCVSLTQPNHQNNPFGLIDCNPSDASQQFVYDPNTLEMQLANQVSKCMVVGQGSRSAGPFMSRKLAYASCMSTDNQYKQWVVKQ